MTLLRRIHELAADHIVGVQYPRPRRVMARPVAVALTLPARIIVLVLSLYALGAGLACIAVGGFVLWVIASSLLR